MAKTGHGAGRGCGKSMQGGAASMKRITRSTAESVTPLDTPPEIVDEDDEDKANVIEEETKPIQTELKKTQKARRGKWYMRGGMANIRKMGNLSVTIEKDEGLMQRNKDTKNKDEVENKKKKKEIDKGKTDTGMKEKKEEGKGSEDSEKDKKEIDLDKRSVDENESKVQDTGKDVVVDTERDKDVEEENIEKQKENKENCEQNDEGEKENLTEEASGCHIETMIGYVNNNEVSVGSNKETDTRNTVENLLFAGETESEKEERMAVIGQSLVISWLEDNLDNILKNKIAVKNTEERIYRLKKVIELLNGFEIKKKEERQVTEQKSEKNEKGNEGDEKQMPSEEKYVKTKVGNDFEEGVSGMGNDKGESTENESEDKTVDNTEETELKGSGKDETEKEKENANSEEGDDKKGVIILDKKKVDKSVRFEIETDDKTEICHGTIQVRVADILNTVAFYKDGDEKNTIDKAYVNFPLSQSQCEKYYKDMKSKEEIEKTDNENAECYSVKTEDITDDEKEMVENRKEEKEDEKDNRSSVDNVVSDNKDLECTEETKKEEMDKNIDEKDSEEVITEDKKEDEDGKESEVTDENIRKKEDDAVNSEEKREEVINSNVMHDMSNIENTNMKDDKNVDTKKEEEEDRQKEDGTEIEKKEENTSQEDKKVDENKTILNQEEKDEKKRRRFKGREN